MEDKKMIKNFKLIFLTALFILAFLHTSCASSKKAAPTEPAEKDEEKRGNSSGYRLPFTLDYHHHTILTFQTDEGITVYLNFDSGCPEKRGIANFEGFKKLTGSDFENLMKKRRDFFDYNFSKLTGKQYEEVSQEEIEELYKSYFNIINTDFSPAWLKSQDHIFTDKDFTFCPAEDASYDKSEADATIGFSFFEGAKRITWNYKEKYIEIDGPEICEKGIPLHYFKASGHWFVPVTIDGQEDYALLDTGSEVFTLREPYFNRQKMLELMNNDKLTFVDYFNEIKKIQLPRTQGQYNKAKSFKLGDLEWENIKALKITDSHMHTGNLSRQIIASSNNIGYPFFADKIIQFDLEKMIFRITE